MTWEDLFRSGKKLRVDLSFNYIDSQLPSGGTTKRGNKRTMLADRDGQLDAEQEATGIASTWQEVYALMRCPGPPCDLGPHCWRDSFGKKHYKLRTEHLKALITFVEQGNILKSHNDVPQDIRDQLYVEERQRLERQPKSNNVSTPFPPINITNVLPQSYQSPMTGSYEPTPEADVRLCGNICLTIPGPWDLAVKEYSEWQQSNVVDEKLKAELGKACEVVLEDGLGLEQVYEDQNPGFFIQSSIKSGITRRFISDIKRWVEWYKSAYDFSTTN